MGDCTLKTTCLIIDRKASHSREIMHLVVPVCPCVCLCSRGLKFDLQVLNKEYHYQSMGFVCLVCHLVDAVGRLLQSTDCQKCPITVYRNSYNHPLSVIKVK